MFSGFECDVWVNPRSELLWVWTSLAEKSTNSTYGMQYGTPDRPFWGDDEELTVA
jgi:hypothetical protein